MTTPTVSIVLPIYNRKSFLPAAFDAIRAQRCDSVEVVVVDDGSVDDSQSVIAQLSESCPFPVHYIYQANQGAYGARNTGVAATRGQYVAFYDSDDVWLPHHLSTCVAALEQHPDVDWVYAACELVELATQRQIAPTSFYQSGTPRPFMRLAHERRGALAVITDPGAIRCQIDYGLFCGLQNSVLRRRVFDRLTLEAATRNEAEDQLFAIRALAAGFHLAYVDNVHVRYQVHAENSSAAGQGLTLEKRRRVFEPLVAGYERLASEVELNPSERRALRRRIGRDLFWQLGYNGYWLAGKRQEALRVFERAIKCWPWDLAQWKTYLVSRVRSLR
ncbi:MAG: glycosyltransferase family 2 protein [Vicinamibacterales bacterium]